MSVWSVAVDLYYRFYVCFHLSKWIAFSLFLSVVFFWVVVFLHLHPTAGGVSRGGVRGAASSSAVRAAPVRALLPRGHRIPHMACTPCWQPVVKKLVERSVSPCPPVTAWLERRPLACQRTRSAGEVRWGRGNYLIVYSHSFQIFSA